MVDRVWERERERRRARDVLFRVGVGNEGVDHEIAAEGECKQGPIVQ